MIEEKVLSIIRLKSHFTDEDKDVKLLAEAGYPGLEFEIPKVKISFRSNKEGIGFIEKPLLLNYGFVRIPISYARKVSTLREIAVISSVILGFFFRKKEEVKLEIEKMEEVETPGVRFLPIWVETISEDELVLLNSEARRIEDKRDYSSLAEGGFIMLRNYPFEGLGAKIIKKRDNGKVLVEILSSQLRVWLDKDSLVYTDLSIYSENGI